MWVRLGTFRVKAGARVELRTAYHERALPRLQSQPGNLGCLLLEPESEGDDFHVLTLWQDRAAAQTYEDSGAASEIISFVDTFFEGPPTLRSYESANVAAL